MFQVNETIKDNVKKFNNQFNASGELDVDIIFIDCADFDLRGYAGANKIYINNIHFQKKIIGSYIPPECLNNLSKLDVMTLARPYTNIAI